MIKIKIDLTEVHNVIAPMKDARLWMPNIIGQNTQILGKKISAAMKEQVQPHRYTGDFEGSINYEWDGGRGELHVGPTVQRGQIDGGLALQEGTKPMHVPWEAIRDWGDFRGFTRQKSWFVTLKIRGFGLNAHPFLDETLNRTDVQMALDEMAVKTGDMVSARVVVSGTTLGVRSFR